MKRLDLHAETAKPEVQTVDEHTVRARLPVRIRVRDRQNSHGGGDVEMAVDGRFTALRRERAPYPSP